MGDSGGSGKKGDMLLSFTYIILAGAVFYGLAVIGVAGYVLHSLDFFFSWNFYSRDIAVLALLIVLGLWYVSYRGKKK